MRLLIGLLCVTVWTAPLDAQHPNLLVNPGANDELAGWEVAGLASTTTLVGRGGNRVFVLVGGAVLLQRVRLPPEAAGQYLLYMAHALGDRLDRPGNITDQPYLYGITLNADERRILSYNQDITMGPRQLTPGHWGRLWGIFQVPTGTASVTFEMRQGLGRGTPRDGSAARFDGLGLFLFHTRSEAQAFIDAQSRRVD